MLTQAKKKGEFHVPSVLLGLFPAVQPDSAEALYFPSLIKEAQICP